MKFWQKPASSVAKFHFGTPSDCQLKNEGCRNPAFMLCLLFGIWNLRFVICNLFGDLKFEI
ncbi:MAG: hypothetical protein GY795_23500 [Desulfobacterales bacterium]|nr:hypothetical protein [Desulfobacterales bacterium]